ncbi:MAG: gamma-glutamyl-gamma-aminobutyrate hydrolase family protein [Pseudomonadota bacterium]
MKLTIAQTGVPPEALRADWPGYSEMFQTMFEAAGLSFTIRVVDVENGETLGDPEPGEALLVTGSRKGVYEGHNFIEPLEASVRHYAEAGAPVVGICFGHQLVAQAFGGTVEKSDRGWGVGVHTYELLKDAPGAPSVPRFACAVSHQDQVTSLPEDFVRLAGSVFTPFGVLAHQTKPVLTFQMHPEFTHGFAEALMRSRADSIPQDRMEMGLATLQNTTDRQLIAEWIGSFLLDQTK